MDITISQEEEKDFNTVENLIRETFWDLYHPGCSEHLVAHKLRQSPDLVKELDLVACDGSGIVGHIMYSKARVEGEDGSASEVLCMGPIAVLKEYQNKGIGSLLMEHSIKMAGRTGYRAIVIFGDPDYYHRFGFRSAEEYGIQTATGENFDAFMVLELQEGSLSGVSGKFYASEVFEVVDEELEDFEKNFPYKEKHVTDTQLG